MARVAHSVLLVEDDDDLRDVLTGALHARGYAVCSARDGREALQMLDAFTPHAIVLDLLMPDMDGFAFLAARAERAELGRIPVVIASAAPPTRDLAASTWNEYLPKPYDVDTLVETLERLWRAHRGR